MSKLSVMPLSGLVVGPRSLLGAFEEAEIQPAAPNVNPCPIRWTFDRDTQKPSPVIPRQPTMGIVLGTSCKAQIAPSIVAGVTVDMVDVCRGPLASHEQPHYSMFSHIVAERVYSSVASGRNRARPRTHAVSSPIVSPREVAVVGVVAQNFLKGRKSRPIGLVGHRKLHFPRGLEGGSIARSFRSRYYIRHQLRGQPTDKRVPCFSNKEARRSARYGHRQEIPT